MCLPICVCLCMCVSALRLLIISNIMWCDMDPYGWLNKLYSCYMATVINGHGLGIDTSHRFYHIIRKSNFTQDNSIRIISSCHKLTLMLISIVFIQELYIRDLLINIIESRDLNEFTYLLINNNLCN